MTEWLSLFADYRIAVIRGDEVIQGILHPELDSDHPRVRAALAAWGGTHFLHQTAAGVEVTLVRRVGPRQPERWWLHGLLALATLLTTTIAGAYFLGRDPLGLVRLSLGSWQVPMPIRLSPAEILPGIGFSVPLMGILLGHEMGHYVVARRHGMDVSPPFFIPSPNWLNVIGTFGAFIRLRSVMINRVMLLDVGVGGPLASFALSVPASLLGLAWSRELPVPPGGSPAPYVVFFQSQSIWLGDSALFHLLAEAAGPGEGVLYLHPLALAGWLGLFVTALNLVPLSQLDGGHILYALFGRAQRHFGTGFLVLLLLLGFSWWGWWFWAGVVLVLGRGTIRHPAVLDPAFPVRGRRRWLGWVCILIFLVTFVPLPLQG